ncbi:MAG: hypothetical protein ACKVJX_23985, partial [Verrucomicrobiia bacterium]
MRRLWSDGNRECARLSGEAWKQKTAGRKAVRLFCKFQGGGDLVLLVDLQDRAFEILFDGAHE